MTSLKGLMLDLSSEDCYISYENKDDDTFLEATFYDMHDIQNSVTIKFGKFTRSQGNDCFDALHKFCQLLREAKTERKDASCLG